MSGNGMIKNLWMAAVVYAACSCAAPKIIPNGYEVGEPSLLEDKVCVTAVGNNNVVAGRLAGERLRTMLGPDFPGQFITGKYDPIGDYKVRVQVCADLSNGLYKVED